MFYTTSVYLQLHLDGGTGEEPVRNRGRFLPDVCVVLQLSFSHSCLHQMMFDEQEAVFINMTE